MINKIQVDNIQRSITIRYALALTLIAVLSLAAYYMLHLSLKNSDSTAYIVNLSGKQRTLSQLIALDAHKIYNARVSDNSIDRYLIQNLERNIEEILQANEILSKGNLPSDVKISLSPIIYKMYFGETDLAQRVKKYANKAEELLKIQDKSRSYEILTAITNDSTPLLIDLNTLVSQYQDEGEEKLEQVKTLEGMLLLSTFFVLLLEVIFIFQPIIRNIMRLTQDKTNLLEGLQDQVEIRTLHLQNANKKLEDLAHHDPLTGLFNRLRLESDIQRLIQQYLQHKAPFAVLMLDIDWFKDVNDTYGHDIGDLVLVEIAKLFQLSCREEDKIYRAGGEEFVILLDRISYQDALNVAQNINERVHSYVFKQGDIKFQKTISIGVCHSSIIFDEDYKMMLKLADEALYQAKENGRNRIEVATKTLVKKENLEDIKKIEIKFKDFEFDTILEINGEFQNILGYNTETFLSSRLTFKDIVYPDDWGILENISKEETTTIRFIKENTHICIFRVNIFSENGVVRMELIDAKSLAKSVRDGLLIYSFNAMLENTNDFIFFKDSNHIYTAASTTLVDVTCVNARDEFVGKIDYELFEKEYSDEYFKLERAVFNGEIDVAQEIQPFGGNGGPSGFVDNRKYPIKDADGNIIGLFGIARIVDEEYKS